jgi:hypothetical protein
MPPQEPLEADMGRHYSAQQSSQHGHMVRLHRACRRHDVPAYGSAGTLTENRMTVVEGWFADVKHSTPPAKKQLPDAVVDDIIMNICLNSKAFYIEEAGKKTEFVGNRTECALLQLCQKEFGVPYDGVRKQYADSIVQARRSAALVPATPVPAAELRLPMFRARCHRVMGPWFATHGARFMSGGMRELLSGSARCEEQHKRRAGVWLLVSKEDGVGAR